MHAMSVAMTEGLASAVMEGRADQAEELARATAGMYGEDPVVIAPSGDPIVGPTPTEQEMEQLRADGAWTGYLFNAGAPRAVGLTALGGPTEWMGAAGSSMPIDAVLASTLSGLARSEVTILGVDGSLVATTLDSLVALELAASLDDGVVAAEDSTVLVVTGGDVEYWVATGQLPGAGVVVFSRSIEDELAVLPGVRRSFGVAGLFTLLLALAVGAGVAVLMLRPVRGLAVAAERVAAGDFEAPVPDSRVEEVGRLGTSFRSMRDALKRRLAELGEANEELEEKQRRLADLQAGLIRQDRLASSARMAAELAHEIRNPVANVRNCLEVVRRALPEGDEGRRFADMAIDELLRMHELAEHLLDLNRPTDASVGQCDPAVIATQVADLAGVGESPVLVEVRANGERADVAVPPDVLKQVLFNLVLNAGEAGGADVSVRIDVGAANGSTRLDVVDDGPGIEPEILSRIFDPFFSTKGGVTGVGLGLFVAEGLVRRYGGRMEAENRTDATGARFSIVLPTATGA